MQAFSNLLKKPNKLLEVSTISLPVAYFSTTFGLQMFAIILRLLFAFHGSAVLHMEIRSLYFNLKLNLAKSSFDLSTSEIHNPHNALS